MATTDYSLERGLPVSMEAERAILAAILLDNTLYDQAAEHLNGDDFSLGRAPPYLPRACATCRRAAVRWT